MEWYARTELLIGQDGIDTLQKARIAVLGLGGVGGGAAEALCRAGVGHLLLVDHDTIDITNLNRQLIATHDVIGQKKALAVRNRLLSINPDGDFTAKEMFFSPDNDTFLFEWQPDYIIDAIDTVTSKLHLAKSCRERDIPLLMCLGTGGRLDPSQLRIGTIADTANGCGCSLARVMRRELKRRGITDQDVLYSLEPPIKSVIASAHGRHAPGSSPFVPPAAGMLMASWVVRQILASENK